MKQNKRADRSICELVLKAFPPDLVSHLVQKVKKKRKKGIEQKCTEMQGCWESRVLRAFMAISEICGSVQEDEAK